MNPPTHRRPRWTALTLLLTAFALRCWNLAAASFWYDEAYSWWVGSQLSLAGAWASSIAETIPPGSYLLWQVWSALTGTTEFALRYSSTLAGVLAVAAGGRIVRRLTERDAGGWAALGLLGIAPPLVWASRELRMYGPLLALTLLAGMALLETLLGPPAQRRRWAWAWGALALGALYTLTLGGFWLVGQGLFALIVLLRRAPAERRAIITTLLPPAALAALLYLPWMLPALGAFGQNHGYWPGHLSAATFFSTALQAATIYDFVTPKALADTLAALVLLTCLLALTLTRRRPLAALYPLLYALPLLPLYRIYRHVPKWGLRHAVIFAPAPYLALAGAWGVVAGWRASRRRSAAQFGLGLATALACAPLLWANLNLLTDPTFANADWRGLTAYVQAHRAPGDLVILQTGAIFPTWYYYAGREAVLRLPDDDLLDVTNVQHYANTAPVLNQHLRAGMDVWLVDWLADVTDPTGVTAALLRDVGAELPAPAFHGLGLRRFHITRTPNFPPEPPTTQRPAIEMLPDLALWGIRLPEGLLPADAPLRVDTWWTAAHPESHADRFYQASLRVYDAEGHLWARLDNPPGGGDYRPGRWTAHVPVFGPFEITLPPGTPPRTYDLSLTLYAWEQTASAIAVGTVEIASPTQTPELPQGMTPAILVAGDAPLRLLGAGLNRPAARPCETLNGQTFWDVAMPLTTTLAARIALGAEGVTLTLPPGDPAQWQPGDRFAAQFSLPIACRALAVDAPLAVTLSTSPDVASWHGPPARIAASRVFEAPADLHAVPENDFGFVRLRGYRLEPERVAAGQPFTLTLTWQATASTDAAYSAFVHVTAPDAPAPLAAQHDAWPAQGARVTFTWVPGEFIADAHPLPGLPAGTYALRVGLYSVDGVRVPLARGPRVFEDALILPLEVH